MAGDSGDAVLNMVGRRGAARPVDQGHRVRRVLMTPERALRNRVVLILLAMPSKRLLRIAKRTLRADYSAEWRTSSP